MAAIVGLVGGLLAGRLIARRTREAMADRGHPVECGPSRERWWRRAAGAGGWLRVSYLASLVAQ